jgi:hypothetical protein
MLLMLRRMCMLLTSDSAGPVPWGYSCLRASTYTQWAQQGHFQLPYIHISLCGHGHVSTVVFPSAAAFPFWPLPASICGAAIQLPDDDSQAAPGPWEDRNEVVQESIELLLSQRRRRMAEAHDSLLPILRKLQL